MVALWTVTRMVNGPAGRSISNVSLSRSVRFTTLLGAVAGSAWPPMPPAQAPSITVVVAVADRSAGSTKRAEPTRSPAARASVQESHAFAMEADVAGGTGKGGRATRGSDGRAGHHKS